ncbi:MAG: hypothetical protein KDL31_10535 [Kiritimatiellae bacterium]|nr:hypothetical protein [Kiritimatiellia bacterium]
MKHVLLLTGLSGCLLVSPFLQAATTVDDTHKHGYGANIGWLNFQGDLTQGARKPSPASARQGNCRAGCSLGRALASCFYHTSVRRDGEPYHARFLQMCQVGSDLRADREGGQWGLSLKFVLSPEGSAAAPCQPPLG